MIRKTVLLIFLGPVFVFLIISGMTFVPFGMACVNWMVGGEGGFWRYFHEVRKELPAMIMPDIKAAWHGSITQKDKADE